MALGDLNVKLGVSLAAFEDGLTKAERKLGKFGKKTTDLGAQLSTGFSAALVAIGAKAVSEFGKFEQLQKGLEAVTKSTVPAAAQIERLKKLAEAPGLGFEQAITASTRLQSVGFSAQFAEQTIKQVANAVALTGGSADNFDSVLKQFTQMIAKGKLLQEDLGIIQENMPAVSDAIQKAFGTTSVEAIRANGVSAQEFVQRVVGELGNFKRVEGGLSNSIDNLGQSVKSFFVSIGEQINEAFNLQDRIDSLSNGLSGLADWFSGLDDNVQRNIIRFAAFLALLGPVLFLVGKVTAVAQVMVLGFKNMALIVRGVASAFTFLLSPVGLVIAAVAALAVGGVYLYKNWDSAKASFINIWIAIENALKRIINNILKGIDSFVNATTFGVVNSNLADKFSFKTKDYVDVPEWKSFGETMKEVGGDLLQYAGLASKAKKATSDLNDSIFSGDSGPAIAGGSPIVKELSEAERKVEDLKSEVKSFQALLKQQGASPDFQNRISDISTSSGGQAAVGAGGFDIVLASRYSTVIQEATDRNSNFKKSLTELAGEALPALDLAMTTTQERVKTFQAAMSSFNEQINSIVTGALADIAEGFGSFLGDLAAGAGSSKNLIALLLIPIAGALEQLGRLAISTGIAISGIKVALESLNPVTAIAGGVALIALSKFVKNRAAKLSSTPALAGGGLAFGETLAVVGDNPRAKANPEVIAPLSDLKKFLPSSGEGGGGFSQVLLRGEDLVIAHDRASTRMNARIR